MNKFESVGHISLSDFTLTLPVPVSDWLHAMAASYGDSVEEAIDVLIEEAWSMQMLEMAAAEAQCDAATNPNIPLIPDASLDHDIALGESPDFLPNETSTPSTPPPPTSTLASPPV